jgi:hypothetical protein
VNWTIAGKAINSSTGGVPKDSTYLFEMKVKHHPSTRESVDITIRMDSANGSVRVSESGWQRRGDFAGSDQDLYYTKSESNWTNWSRSLQVGTNGWGGGTASSPHLAFHWGAVAICTDWCGPYSSGR